MICGRTGKEKKNEDSFWFCSASFGGKILLTSLLLIRLGKVRSFLLLVPPLSPLSRRQPKRILDVNAPADALHRPQRIHDPELERAQQRDKHLVQLDHRDVLAQTPEAAAAKDQLQRALHRVQARTSVVPPAGVDPPVGPEDVGVGAVDVLAAVRRDLADGDLDAAGQEDAVHRLAARRRDLGLQTRDGRPHAQALFDAGLQVGQPARLGRRDDGARDVGAVGVEFVHESAVDGRVGEDVQQRHADRGRGRVGAAEDLQHRLALGLLLGEAVAHERAQHVRVVFRVGAVALAHDALRDAEHRAHADPVRGFRREERLHRPAGEEAVDDGEVGAALQDLQECRRRRDVRVDVFVLRQVAEGGPEGDVCQHVQREVLRVPGEVDGSVTAGGFAADQRDEVEDARVDVGFEVGDVAAGVLQLSFHFLSCHAMSSLTHRRRRTNRGRGKQGNLVA